MLFLKQSTAVTVNIGPFIDDTDGKTAETGLTEHPADILLAKNGGDFAAKNEASNLTHDNLGWYHCPIDATDTNALGRLQLHCHEAGFLPVFHEYTVLPANVFDSLISGSAADLLDVSVVQIAGTAQSATDLKDFADTGYDPATHKVAGVVLVDTTTTNTDVTVLQADVGDASASTKGSIYGILGNPAANNHTVTLENVHDTDLPAVKTDTAAILTDTSELQTDWVNGGRLDLLIDSILGDSNELQTDWLNGGRLDLLLDSVITNVGAVDTVVDAIKAITDLLTLAAIADAVHDEAIEGAITGRQSLRYILAALAGKTSEAVAGTMRIRDANDTADRIVATMDANRYRTDVALTP